MKGETVLMFDYSVQGRWRPTAAIARLLAQDNRVVLVERLQSYDELRWRGASPGECFRRFRSSGLTHREKNLTILKAPPGFPTSVSLLSRFMDKSIKKFSWKSSRRFQARWIRNQLRREGIAPTVLFLNHPTDLLLLGAFREKVSCWRVYDELAALPTGTGVRDALAEIEKEYLSRVDMVFTSSRAQYENRRRRHPRVYCVPNAVDGERFHPGKPPARRLPMDLRVIPRPRIGVVGSLDWRLDLSLLNRLSQQHLGWSLVLIGWTDHSQKEAMARLAARGNVYLLGPRPAESIPDYLRGLDAGIIPFKVDSATRSMLPLKLFEFLGAGLPVVATNLDELRPYSAFVRIARDQDAFLRLLDEALAGDNPRRREARRRMAARNTWAQRTQHMMRLIDRRLRELAR